MTRVRWSDETPLECAACCRPFADDDDVSHIGSDEYCDWCAEKFLPEAMDTILAEAREHWGPSGPSDKPDCLALVEKLAAKTGET